MSDVKPRRWINKKDPEELASGSFYTTLKLTLLSNAIDRPISRNRRLDPYEFTLLSNVKFIQDTLKGGALAPIMGKANEGSELPQGILIPHLVFLSEQFELHADIVTALLQLCCAAHSSNALRQTNV